MSALTGKFIEKSNVKYLDLTPFFPVSPFFPVYLDLTPFFPVPIQSCPPCYHSFTDSSVSETEEVTMVVIPSDVEGPLRNTLITLPQ